MNRFRPSILVEASGQKFIFDAGRGALQRLTQINAFRYDIRIRLYDDRTAQDGVVILAKDISEGLVYENNG
ncbi:hypothetical protein [Bradyrhizobium sp. MOS003]|uniref:hypothetical protein n=1 Tax=Bradyrhizobium sp. MOS003 TaxID=2133946 RepID=UPI000D12AB8C|nr:hypothetical protein [Bradyrhizobium sp. MOS003]PSO15045.1 hypothetical protein C7G42_29590 [Bradyrhizobium sp. MOS003]